jgi:TRAP-type C4-dicarboxylate transport system permease small subunit
MAQDVLNRLRRLNRSIAILVGIGLLLCAAFVLSDILLRQVGASFGGTDEISGYAMAIAAAWGMSFTLLEMGHVRIDFLRSRSETRGRVIFDLLSMLILTFTVSVIAFECWPVVAKSLANDSRANTVLETPMWIVQIPWFVGWIWFAMMSWITLVCAMVLFMQGKFAETESTIGAFAEQDALL